MRAANAHFANMLLGFYLATGQDAANIVEGSQGFTLAECAAMAICISVTLPNLIVGTVGTAGRFVQDNLPNWAVWSHASRARMPAAWL